MQKKKKKMSGEKKDKISIPVLCTNCFCGNFSGDPGEKGEKGNQGRSGIGDPGQPGLPGKDRKFC